LVTFRHGTAFLICALVALGCKEKPTTGSLVVAIDGLPSGANAAVTVAGPGYSKSVLTTTTLEDLPPGEYTVTIGTVQFSSALYSSPVILQKHTITAGHSENATVSYALASGSINVSVSGLPAFAIPILTLNGPAGFSRTVQNAGLVGALPPGTYVLRADTLTSGAGDKFGATDFLQSFAVVASLTPVEASVTYVLVSGSLDLTVDGLPAGQNPPPVTVAGPSGFRLRTAVSTTLRGLKAGSYTITAVTANGTCPDTYTPNQTSQSADVAIGSTASASVSFIHSQVAAADLNLKIDALHLVQVVQDYQGATPIVAGKPALLRVFGVANQCNFARPKIRVTVSGVVQPDIQAIESSVRQNADQGVLQSSWNLLLPGSVVQPGLTVSAQIDPDNAVAESNESDNQFPAAGPKPIDVRVMPTVGVRFIPVSIAGNAANVSAARLDSFLVVSRKIHPAFDYDADIGAPFASGSAPLKASGEGWSEVLRDLEARRVTDSTASPTARYYVGMVRVTYNAGVAGLGYIGGKSTLSWDFPGQSTPEIVAHELGHNYAQFHAPCGGAGGPDPNYPNTGGYAGGYIGQYGYDLAEQTLRQPEFFTDIMGYCQPKWISDYMYKRMMQWLIDHPVSLPSVSSAEIQPSLLVWGRIVNGRPMLEPTFEINARPELPRSSGPNRLAAVDDAGNEIFSLSFAAQRIADLPGDEQSFAFAIPQSMLRGRTLASLRLSAGGRTATNATAGDIAADAETVVRRTGPGRARLQWNAAKFPVVMVRDPVRGEVLSFARGGDVTIATVNDQLELVYPNRVHGGRVIRQLK